MVFVRYPIFDLDLELYVICLRQIASFLIFLSTRYNEGRPVRLILISHFHSAYAASVVRCDRIRPSCC
jgi:hypothetical protein